MRTSFVAFICGVVFAAGLGISGMTRPAKVTAFLDFSGNWDPSLLFVMAGAILVYGIGYRLVLLLKKPVWSEKFQIPNSRKIDGALLLGATLFGVGWGLAGFCPGPAFTSLSSFRLEPVLFTAALILGMALFEWQKHRRLSRSLVSQAPQH